MPFVTAPKSAFSASVAWVQPTFFSRLGHILVATAEAVGFTHATACYCSGGIAPVRSTIRP
jgi:hypothetical protein